MTYTARPGRRSASGSGLGIAIVGPTGPGGMAIHIDGRRVGTVDQRASVYRARRLLFVDAGLASGTHTLRILELYSPGRQRTDIDALLILR